MKKLTCCALVLALLMALSSASAGSAGGPTDPLITRSYAQSVYKDAVTGSLTAAALERLQAIYDEAAAPYARGQDTSVKYTAWPPAVSRCPPAAR